MAEEKSAKEIAAERNKAIETENLKKQTSNAGWFSSKPPKCPNCGAFNPQGSKVCKKCKTPLE